MPKIICIIFLSFITRLASAQSNLTFSHEELRFSVNTTEIEQEPRLVLDVEQPRPKMKTEKFNGYEIVSFYWDNNRLADQYKLIDGRKEGIRKVFYESGSLQQEIPYKKGLINGTKKYYHKNGMIAIETIYIKGVREGNRTMYFDATNNETGSSHIAAITPYKNNKINGWVKNYKRTRDTYHLDYEAHFVGGIPDGKWITYEEGFSEDYSKNGIYKSQVETNVAGKKSGPDSSFRFDGTCYSVIFFNNGKVVYEDLFDSGNTKLYRNNYKNGERDGLYKSFFENGTTRMEIEFRAGKKWGKYMEFHPNGKLKEKASFEADIQNGLEEEYYENGFFKSSTNYEKGKKLGTQKFYFQDGLLREENEFDNKGTQIVQIVYRRKTGEKRDKHFYEDGSITKSECYDKKGGLLFTNHYYKGRPIGFYKRYREYDILDTKSFIDSSGNSYSHQMSDDGTKIVDFYTTYKLKNNQVSKEEFFKECDIVDDKVVKKNSN